MSRRDTLTGTAVADDFSYSASAVSYISLLRSLYGVMDNPIQTTEQCGDDHSRCEVLDGTSHERGGSQGTVVCQGGECTKITVSLTAMGEQWDNDIRTLKGLQDHVFQYAKTEYAQLVLPRDVSDVCRHPETGACARRYTMTLADGAPLADIFEDRGPDDLISMGPIEIDDGSLAEGKVHPNIRETLRRVENTVSAMQEAGLYHNDLHEGNIFVHMTPTEVLSVSIIDWDEASEVPRLGWTEVMLMHAYGMTAFLTAAVETRRSMNMPHATDGIEQLPSAMTQLVDDESHESSDDESHELSGSLSFGGAAARGIHGGCAMLLLLLTTAIAALPR
jgi:hypothetical protein